MTFSALALASAFAYGAADFIGGLTSRRADTVVIVVVSQGAGLVMVTLLLPFLPASVPGHTDWIWGGVAGLTGGAGVALLYRALAISRMAVVAPITAVCAVAVPVVVAVLRGERPGFQASGGMVLALVGIALVSQQREPAAAHPLNPAAPAIGLALASGVAIGLFFLALARTSPQAGMWPLLTARLVSVTMFGAWALYVGRSLRMPRSLLATAAAGGVLDMIANLFYLLAARLGPLTLVVTLSSLYPASTVLLARLVLRERIAMLQWIGVFCALVAIVLIVSST